MNNPPPHVTFDTPVCLIIFRRPDHTRQVLEAIAKVKPSRLFVVADGPRHDHPGDAEACAATRAIIELIDWPCEVVKNYSDINLGCGIRPSSGISWVFEHVEEAIILEDDCIPEPSFFPFCAELLARYRHEHKIMQICGSTYRSEDLPIKHSYYYSPTPGCWGWATWKRAWKFYDGSVRQWPQAKHGPLLMECMDDDDLVNEYEKSLDLAYELNGNCSFWDYQWSFACQLNGGLSITPKNNLIRNVGFGADATHTIDQSGSISFPTRPMQFPLIHPDVVAPDMEIEKYYKELDKQNSKKNTRRGLLRGGLQGSLARKVASFAPSVLKSALRRAF